MCRRYDEEIEALYDQVAELEGYSMANALELEQIEAKRREDEAQRMVRLLHLTAPTLEPAAAPSPPAPHPSSGRPRARGRKRHRAWDGDGQREPRTEKRVGAGCDGSGLVSGSRFKADVCLLVPTDNGCP